MPISNDVAEVALVVSLVALIISGLQLLQQLFGTSEGWSRCGPLVIGRWSRLRSSRWLWTEMRYETKFVTPRIILLHGDVDLDTITAVSDLFKQRSWQPFAFTKSPWRLYQRAHSIIKFWDSSLDAQPKTQSMSFKHPSHVDSYFKTQLAVTWPELIHYLGRYYYLQVENMLTVLDTGATLENTVEKLVSGTQPANRTTSVAQKEAQSLPLISSVIGLKLEQRSWDAMPPGKCQTCASDRIVIGGSVARF